MAAHIDLNEERKFSPISDVQSRYKLLNNLDRVLGWIQTGDTVPILINLTLTNRCTHKCPMCTSKDLLDDRTAPLERVKEIITELKSLGVKAFGLGGGGDPTCHPHFEEVIRFIGEQGMEVGITTNGQLLTPGIIAAAVEHCTWMRVSLDADCPETYRKVHGLGQAEFEQVKQNVRALVAEKKRQGSSVALGATYLLGQHTLDGAYGATALARELGVDYMRLRPFFIWQTGKGKKDAETQLVELERKRTGGRSFDEKRAGGDEFFAGAAAELERCKTLETDSFSVSFPEARVNRKEELKKRVHRCCSVHHFTVVIAADLNVYPCCMLEDTPKYVLGNLKNQSFREMWESSQRRDACSRIDFSDCPNPCMLENHNELLWELREGQLRSDTKLSDILDATRTKIPHANFL
ncbi:MAG: radical SAM protein [Bdellovibrionota bacterium]